MPVIDAHVHLYPEAVNRDPAGWAVANHEPAWARMCTRVRKATGRAVQRFPSVDALLGDMDTAGVDRAVLLGWYWENQTSCVMQNRFYAQCVREHPDRFYAFATVNPAAGEAALTEMRWAKNEGFVGLGELSPHSIGVGVQDSRWQAVLALAGELGLLVNLHVTEPESGPYPGRVETPLADFVAMARAWPQVRFILAHWGGRLWRAVDPLPANVWLDTAASPLLYGSDGAVWSEGLSTCGAERILWGTDYPLDLYPKNENCGTLAGFLNEAKGHVPPASLSAVLGENVARLIGR